MSRLHARRNIIIAGGLALLVVVVVTTGGLWLTHFRFGSSPNGNQHVVSVRELGIQLIVPDSIKDLNYTVTTVPLDGGWLATIAGFSTSALTVRDPGCSPDDKPLGSLNKVLGQYPSNDPTAAVEFGILVKQFPTFFIAAGSPQSVCSSDSTTQALASQDRSAFLAAESSIQPLN